jgi:hypothetical protein
VSALVDDVVVAEQGTRRLSMTRSSQRLRPRWMGASESSSRPTSVAPEALRGPNMRPSRPIARSTCLPRRRHRDGDREHSAHDHLR